MSQNNEDEENEIKVILLGEAGVGKTNLINRATGQDFNPFSKTTGSSSFSKMIVNVRNKNFEINLWDTIGQEQFRQLTKLFYNNSKIVIFVYDITSHKSIDELKNYWVKDIESKLGNDIIKGVVANKIDLYLEEEVKEDEGEEFAKSIDAKFLTISAKTDNADKFKKYITELVEDFLLSGLNTGSDRITLSTNTHNKNNKNCCK
jgi:small GTP-binding protein